MNTQRRFWRILAALFALSLLAAACGGDDDDDSADSGDDDTTEEASGGGSDATVCMESEFPDRTDGLMLWEAKGDYELPESMTQVLDTNVIYNQTANGDCAFGEVYTTDGRIQALDLTLVEDDGAMIIYNISMNVRDDAYQQAPEAFDTIAEETQAPLDEDTMAALNAAVSVDGEDQSAVAKEYLEDEGLVTSDGDGTFDELDMSGVSVTVGSKDFTEQLVLGQIAVQSFEAAGADVTDQVNLGGTQVNRQALLSGDIDVYYEYNGTGWTEHLGNEDPSDDPEELTELVRDQDLEENDIHWLSRSPFSNTYAFATGPDLTEEHGGAFDITEMGEYLGLID